MNFELSGKLIVKGAVQDVTASFRKREFVIEVANERNADWNDYIKFQLTQDRCAVIEPFQEGDVLKVTFNIRGRKWEKDGRVNYFSNLEAWRVEKVAQESAVPPPPPPPVQEEENFPFADSSDLPF